MGLARLDRFIYPKIHINKRVCKLIFDWPVWRDFDYPSLTFWCLKWQFLLVYIFLIFTIENDILVRLKNTLSTCRMTCKNDVVHLWNIFTSVKTFTSVKIYFTNVKYTFYNCKIHFLQMLNTLFTNVKYTFYKCKVHFLQL